MKAPLAVSMFSTPVREGQGDHTTNFDVRKVIGEDVIRRGLDMDMNKLFKDALKALRFADPHTIITVEDHGAEGRMMVAMELEKEQKWLLEHGREKGVSYGDVCLECYRTICKGRFVYPQPMPIMLGSGYTLALCGLDGEDMDRW